MKTKLSSAGLCSEQRSAERERCVKQPFLKETLAKELETLLSELQQVAYDTSENGRELHLGHVEQYIEKHIAKLSSAGLSSEAKKEVRAYERERCVRALRKHNDVITNRKEAIDVIKQMK